LAAPLRVDERVDFFVLGVAARLDGVPERVVENRIAIEIDAVLVPATKIGHSKRIERVHKHNRGQLRIGRRAIACGKPALSLTCVRSAV
jgi:hypothetical protein